MGMERQLRSVCVYSVLLVNAELAWILNCFTYMGELNRMTQFKDKSAKHADNINAGLFTYPVLMAADILLYQADVVPVGIDQMQHLELTRDIATRFNNIYGDVFTIPEAYVGKVGAKIMSLQDPSKKMSKSDENPNGSIYLMDDPDTIIRKCKRAVTDSEANIAYREEQPGLKNLIDIYCACEGKTPDEAVKEFEGRGYGELKMAVGEAVVSVLKPLQDEVSRLEKDKAYLDSIIKENAEKADLIIYVVDASRPLDENDHEIIEMIRDKKAVILLNKSDLSTVVDKKALETLITKPMIDISAKEETGIHELESTLKEMFYHGDISFNDEVYITNIRHKTALADALSSLKKVEESIENQMPEDFFTIDLMDAYESLGSITGETIGEDLVNEIFSKFCMGK